MLGLFLLLRVDEQDEAVDDIHENLVLFGAGAGLEHVVFDGQTVDTGQILSSEDGLSLAFLDYRLLQSVRLHDFGKVAEVDLTAAATHDSLELWVLGVEVEPWKFTLNMIPSLLD